MKRLYLLLIFVILCSALLSQATPEWLWAKSAGGNSIDEGESITTDSSGNCYVTGYFYGSTTFGTTTLTSMGDDIFIAKLDANGNWLWVTSAGGTNSDLSADIAVDSNGNVYVTGFFLYSATFGTTSLTSSGSRDIFVTKLDNNGNWLWAKQAGGISNDGGNSISLDSTGNIYVSGFFCEAGIFGTTTLTSVGSSDMFVSKLDPDGNWLWAKSAGGPENDMENCVSVDSTGNCYVSGYYVYTITLGTTTLTSISSIDLYVSKLDTNGNWLWTSASSGTGGCYGQDMEIDSNGNCFVTGLFGNSTTFGSTTINGSGFYNACIAKLDDNGNWQWAYSVDGADETRGYGISADSDGNCYATGFFRNTATFGLISLNSIGHTDVYVAKLDTNGNWLWVKQAGGSSINSVEGMAIDTDTDGNSYVTGKFYGGANFGESSMLTSNSFDIFIAKLSADVTLIDDSVVPGTARLSHLADAYPNPCNKNEDVNIKAEIASSETGSLIIYNMKGQRVESRKLSSGKHSISFSGNSLASGIYFYRLHTPSLNIVKKLVLIKG